VFFFKKENQNKVTLPSPWAKLPDQQPNTLAGLEMEIIVVTGLYLLAHQA
jgi:hypothetical protein